MGALNDRHDNCMSQPHVALKGLIRGLRPPFVMTECRMEGSGERLDPRGLESYTPALVRGRSSAGRALQSHCRGQEFKSPRLHYTAHIRASDGTAFVYARASAVILAAATCIVVLAIVAVGDGAAIGGPVSAQSEPTAGRIYLPTVRSADRLQGSVADRLMRMRGPIDAWDWEGGVAMAALMATRDTLATDGAAARATEWVDAALREGRAGFSHPNNVVGAWAALMLHERSPNAEYHALAERAVEFILVDAPRVEGSLAHAPDQLWVDTLFMCAPLLAHLGVLDKRPELLDQAADEVLAHARRLQNPETGLWYHGWSTVGGHNFANAYWARGNGWAALATSEVLRRLPRSHPKHAALLDIHLAHLRGLIRVQDSSGMWRTVVDRPDFYLETSGSAAITAALYRAIDSGWLSRDNLLFPDAGRRAVEARILRDGTVTGVSAGTGVGLTLSIYNVIDRTEIKPYGQGLTLFMLAAAEEARRTPR